MSDRVRAHLIVSGHVQGVYYRSTSAETGLKLGLTGWSKNLPNGTVEIVAEGDKDQIAKLIKWCHKGPPTARVEGVEVIWEAPTGEFDAFRVTL
jgi:acylphosphatase